MKDWIRSLWIIFDRPVQPTARPNVGCYSKTGHAVASQRNDGMCQQATLATALDTAYQQVCLPVPAPTQL